MLPPWLFFGVLFCVMHLPETTERKMPNSAPYLAPLHAFLNSFQTFLVLKWLILFKFC